MSKKPKKIFKKIFARVSLEDLHRIEQIKKKFGFKSNYQILQYLLYCFLRVADPDNDPIDEPVPSEIEEMFTNFTEFEDKFYVTPRRDYQVERKKKKEEVKQPTLF